MFKKLKSFFNSNSPPSADEIKSFKLCVNRSATHPISSCPSVALLCCDVGDGMTGMQYASCWGSEALIRDCVASVERGGTALAAPMDLRHAGEENWFPWLLVKYCLPKATQQQRELVLDPLGISKDRLNVLLMDAVRTNHVDCVEVLIQQGANVNFKASHNEDMTPLCKAAALGEWEICKVLLDRGARVNDVDIHGCSALHWAARKGNGEILEKLIERGGDAKLKSTQTYGFKTPIELLEERNK